MFEFLEKLSVYARYDGVPEYLMALIFVLIICLCGAGVVILLKNKIIKKYDASYRKLESDFNSLTDNNEDLTVVFKDEEVKNLKMQQEIVDARKSCTNAYAILETALVDLGSHIAKEDL